MNESVAVRCHYFSTDQPGVGHCQWCSDGGLCPDDALAPYVRGALARARLAIDQARQTKDQPRKRGTESGAESRTNQKGNQ